jgi:hypothetical protein
MPPPAAPAPSSLSAQQLNQLKAELERELRWLTGTAALEWLGLPGDNGRRKSQDGARMQSRLTQVLEALDRIKSGSYGTCARCRSPIAFERLQVIPETTTCIQCGQH